MADSRRRDVAIKVSPLTHVEYVGSRLTVVVVGGVHKRDGKRYILA